MLSAFVHRLNVTLHLEHLKKKKIEHPLFYFQYLVFVGV